ncbi:hypothetical protein A8B81_15775 [Sulfitobacter pontiacus]|uniref:hypothetical protein n=1 Tax=Sulfitobacter pontiacus TaxID=60137 RepID=UPI0007D995CB|nr:hypothetical protein [Sulfitobacter pontiacus]OAN77248.1 hypothetical protein A8B81_15775 [Sulfitobacter pontiacus]
MNDDPSLFLFLLFAALVIWFLFFRETAAQKQARKEEEERRERERQRFEEERRKTREAAKKEFDSLVSPGMPAGVQRSHREFLAGSSLPRGQQWYGEDVSPLTYYGYRVGKTRGLRETERYEVIRYVLRARLGDPLAKGYQRSWGRPLSRQRRSAICGHLDKLAAQRASRRNYEIAVAHWEADSAWTRRHQDDEISKFDSYNFD